MKSGITGRMSNFPQFHMKEGRTMTGRILLDARSSASTASKTASATLCKTGLVKLTDFGFATFSAH